MATAPRREATNCPGRGTASSFHFRSAKSPISEASYPLRRGSDVNRSGRSARAGAPGASTSRSMKARPLAPILEAAVSMSGAT